MKSLTRQTKVPSAYKSASGVYKSSTKAIMLTVMEETLDIYINDGISHQTDSNQFKNLTEQQDHLSFHNCLIGAQLPSGHGPGAYINPLILAPDWTAKPSSQSQLSYQKA